MLVCCGLRSSYRKCGGMQELEMVFQQEDGVRRVLEAAVLKEGDPLQVANGKGHADYLSIFKM